MKRLTDAAADMIEPAAKAMIPDVCDDNFVVAASIAVSLKRLADAVGGDATNKGIVEILWEMQNRRTA